VPLGGAFTAARVDAANKAGYLTSGTTDFLDWSLRLGDATVSRIGCSPTVKFFDKSGKLIVSVQFSGSETSNYAAGTSVCADPGS
jgi:hypothetical protein